VAANPFPNRPPKYVRALLYEYRFADPGTYVQTGQWWGRRLAGQPGRLLAGRAARNRATPGNSRHSPGGRENGFRGTTPSIFRFGPGGLRTTPQRPSALIPGALSERLM